MTWPDPTATVSTTDIDNDTDSLTAARADILDLAQKFNSVLGTCTIASTPWTDLNDTTIQKRISGGTTSGIVTQDANGDVQDSGVTIETTLTDSNTKSPTSKAVKTYADAVSPTGVWSYHATFSTSGTQYLGSTTTIPSTAFGLRFVFGYLRSSSITDYYIRFGDSSNSPIYAETDGGAIHTTSWVNNGVNITPQNQGSNDIIRGVIECHKLDANDIWIASGVVANLSDGDTFACAGYVSGASAFDSVRVQCDTGDTFYAGSSCDLYILS